jgi:dethiobiotin synthetase
LYNEDALRLQDAGSLAVPYELINLYAFEPPVAPHIAALAAGREINGDVIRNCFQALAELADVVIVEGVGGWRVPLASDLEVSDIPGLLGVPALLVVGLKLGCLNHALLSADSIMEKGCGFAGWIANQVDPEMQRVADNVSTLEERIPQACLGKVGYLGGKPDLQAIVSALDGLGLRAVIGG